MQISRQKRIARYLKILSVVVGAALIAFTVIAANFVVSERGSVFFHRPAAVFYFWLLWYSCILCLMIFYRMWRIFNEIGKANSFSMENAHSFRLISVYSFLIFAGYPVGIIFAAAAGCLTHALVFMSAVTSLISLAFGISCRCLSALTANAYEIKSENDLTI